MKFRSLHKWKLTPELDGLLFLAQRLDELLFEFTLDSYKPSALSSGQLCREALRVVQGIEKREIEEHNLPPILEELVNAIAQDPVAKALLDADLDKYVHSHPETPLPQKKIGLQVLARTLNDTRYLAECAAQLEKAVENSEKIQIDVLASKLVSTLINSGVGKSYLSEQAQEFFFRGSEPQLESPGQVVSFMKLIWPVQHDFEVYFLVSQDIRRVSKSIENFRIELMSTFPSGIVGFATASGFLPSPTECIVKVTKIRASDRFTARVIAERRIDTLRDMFTLFSHRNDLYWRPNALIGQCCNDKLVIVDMPSNPMQRRIDPNASFASRKLNWMLQRLELRKSTNFAKFLRVVDLHGICAKDSVPENQLLNLWISLETLVPAKEGKAKIATITAAIDPFIRRTYVVRLVHCALRDLMLWDNNWSRRILRKVVGGKGLPMAQRLLRLLALDENASTRTEMYAALKDFHLLRFRLWKLHETLKTPKSTRSAIESHAQRVEWQIRRLYRVRNMLVHAGESPPFLTALIENGHDYLDLVLDEIIDLSCGEREIRTVEQAFELERILSQEIMSQTSRGDQWTAQTLDALYVTEVDGADYAAVEKRQPKAPA